MKGELYEAVASGIRFCVVDEPRRSTGEVRVDLAFLDDGSDGGNVTPTDLADPEKFRQLIRFNGIWQFRD